MNAISSGRKVETTLTRRIPPFVKAGQIPEGDKCTNTRELVAMIRHRWFTAGYEVPVWVEADGSIHSDTVNGLPVAKILEFKRGQK